MHIDARSWYSFHDGVSSPEALFAQAAELGFDALGVCDVDGVYGLIRCYQAALKQGIKPLLGVGLTDPRGRAKGEGEQGAGHREQVRDGQRELPPGSKGAPYGHPGDGGGSPGLHDPSPVAATVIARDRDGYSELCELATARRTDPGFELRRALAGGTEHCVVLSDAPALLGYLAPRLGPRRLGVRLAPDYGDAYRARQLRQLKLARHFKLKAVACTGVRFLRPQDQPLHHVLRAIGQNATLGTAQGVVPRTHYLSAPVEIAGYYYECPEAVDAARELAEHCNVEFDLGVWRFPDYPLKGGGDPRRALRDLCQRGLVWRYGSRGKGAGYGQEHLTRLDYELKVIDELGYTSYFLAVYDIVRAAGRMGVPLVGRGSAANSIVSYLLGLTPVDPIALDMYFERFLNPERTSPPDIDIDFSSKRRDDVLDYVYRRWGRERVAMISTHVTFRARGAFREVGKVFGLGDRELSRVSKLMPHTSAEGLATIKRDYPEMRGVDLSAEPYRQVIPLASRLGGIPRHLGIHCGGIVIAPGKLTEYTALERASKGLMVTQYEMFSVEDVGLIKIDLLGNCGLDALEGTLQRLARRGVRPPVHRLEDVVRDPATVAMVREGRTMGCFYIESPAMRQLLKRLRTQTFLELTAASSVIRPGVAESGMMQEYIRRVRGAEPQLPSHPLMLKLLPETRGVMIYQEDVIKVGHELAGLSRAEADLLRRAMSGKLRSMERMNEVRERFVTGCEGNGIDTQSALTIWRQVASFGGYSFCKAHSASFASLSYKVAYLKAHYPAEYMAAVLSHSGGFYGQRAYLSECERLGLRVLPPDVNYSGLDYEAEGPAAIRVSLGEIKGVRREVLGRIVDKRGRGGRYTSLGGFIRHVRPPEADLGVLIQCGALDSLGLSRPEMQWLADGEYKAALNGGGLPLDETHCLADFRSRVGAKLRDHDELAKLDLELTHFGMLISRHPLTLIGTPPPGVIKACELSRHVGRQVRLLGWCVTTKRVGIRQRREVKDTLALQAANLDAPAALNGAAGDDEERDNPAAELGIIRKGEGPRAPYQHHRDRRAMKFMSMEDLSGTFEAVLFPRAYEQFAPITGYAGPYLVSGVVEEQFDTYTVDVRSLKLLPLPVGE